jgi:hypothetical protein
MRGIKTIVAELTGLFVDDWRYAGAIVLWLIVVALFLPRHAMPAVVKGPLLFAGLSAILLVSVTRRAGR